MPASRPFRSRRRYHPYRPPNGTTTTAAPEPQRKDIVMTDCTSFPAVQLQEDAVITMDIDVSRSLLMEELGLGGEVLNLRQTSHEDVVLLSSESQLRLMDVDMTAAAGRK